MELPLVPDLAARQIIDSTRSYREFLRVRNDLRKLGGALRWKKIGGYEYLVQRAGHRLVYLGRRSPELEQRQLEHDAAIRRLQERFTSLREVIGTYDRMNKAVRAGTAPGPLVGLLTALDDLGLSGRSVVVGAPALYAYGQGAGLVVDSVTSEPGGERVVPMAEKRIHLLVEDPGDWGSVHGFQRLAEAVSPHAEVERAVSREGALGKTVLEIVFHTAASPRSSAEHPQKHSQRHPQKHAQKRTSVAAPSVEHSLGEASWVSAVCSAPKFEQVVIGKTGRMALMQTVDPRLFAELRKRLVRPSLLEGESASVALLQARLVEVLLERRMVNSKLDEAQCRQLLERLPSQVEAPH